MIENIKIHKLVTDVDVMLSSLEVTKTNFVRFIDLPPVSKRIFREQPTDCNNFCQKKKSDILEDCFVKSGQVRRRTYAIAAIHLIRK